MSYLAFVSSAVTGIAYVTNEGSGDVTESAGSFADLADPGTVALAGGERYLGIFSTDVNLSNAGGLSETQILVDGTSIYSTPMKADVRGTTGYESHGGIFVIQPVGSGTHTVKFQGRRLNAGTATFRNRRLTLVRMGPSDVYADSLALQSWSSPLAQTAAAMSFTPALAGDYLIIASLLPYMPGSTFSAYLTDGTNSTPGHALNSGSGGANSRNPTVIAWYQSSLSGSKTYSLKVTGSGTCGVSEVRMVAIRVDQFRSAHQALLSGSDNSGSQSSYTNALSQTFTPLAADHLSIAAWQQSNGTTGAISSIQFSDGGTSVNEVIAEELAGSGDGHSQGFAHRVAAYTAASRTQALQRKAVGGGSAFLKSGSQIVTFDLTGYGGAPTFAVAPSISTNTGFFAEGDTATVSYTHTGISTTYQWTRDGSPISGATTVSYTYQAADVGHTVNCAVTAANAWGSANAQAVGTTIGTPTHSINPRVTSSGDARVTSSGDARVIYVRIA